MIKFKKGNFIDECSLTKEEAKEFIKFLKNEIIRHDHHLEQYYNIAKDESRSDLMRVVAQTVVIRDMDDIKHTKKTIYYLQKKFGLEDFEWQKQIKSLKKE